MVRWLASTMTLLPLLVGSGALRTEPNPPRLEDCPFAVDPNLVVGKLLACVQVELGRQWIHTRTWSDPEGDPAEVKILKAPPGVQIINRPKVHSYTLLWTPTQIMTAAIVVQATDRPAQGKPASSIGTILVQVIPHGQRPAPHGCGSPPQ
ncbi:MAG: hypothetical protein M1376_10360 [Planctomycetes bacterium]|nr:hypothetical protein [Planctomycetota bacterium]